MKAIKFYIEDTYVLSFALLKQMFEKGRDAIFEKKLDNLIAKYETALKSNKSISIADAKKIYKEAKPFYNLIKKAYFELLKNKENSVQYKKTLRLAELILEWYEKIYHQLLKEEMYNVSEWSLKKLHK
jgi:hypothetical protein